MCRWRFIVSEQEQKRREKKTENKREKKNKMTKANDKTAWCDVHTTDWFMDFLESCFVFCVLFVFYVILPETIRQAFCYCNSSCIVLLCLHWFMLLFHLFYFFFSFAIVSFVLAQLTFVFVTLGFLIFLCFQFTYLFRLSNRRWRPRLSIQFNWI